MAELFCEYCGVSFMRQALLAMLIDLGARSSSDPVECYESPDGEHRFVEVDTDKKETEAANGTT